MSTLKYLLQKEFRQIFRNPTILRMILIVPVVQLIILPLAADFEIKNINISIVDNDRSVVAHDLIEEIKSSGYFKLVNYTHDYQVAFSDIESDETDIVLEIPDGLESDLIREQKGSLFIAVNAINGTKAYVGGAYLTRIITGFNQDIRAELNPGNKSCNGRNACFSIQGNFIASVPFHNGVDTEMFSSSVSKLDSKREGLIFVGNLRRFNESRGIDFIIDAFKASKFLQDHKLQKYCFL